MEAAIRGPNLNDHMTATLMSGFIATADEDEAQDCLAEFLRYAHFDSPGERAAFVRRVCEAAASMQVRSAGTHQLPH